MGTQATPSGAQLEALEALSAAVGALAEEVRRSTAPAAVMEQARQLAEQAGAALAPHRFEGCLAQFTLDGSEMPPPFEAAPVVDEARDLVRAMPYSPIQGRCNPMSQRFVFTLEPDGRAHGSGRFPDCHTGPPGCAHGGLIAAMFDELLSMAAIAARHSGFTARLAIDYLAPTPQGRDLQFSSRLVRTEGRKTYIEGEIRDGDTVTARCEGLFVRPRGGGDGGGAQGGR